MKFKYYLRGVGIGMIIATVILSIAFLFHRDLSDAEIMKRAMALGMVMEGAGQGGTLADSVAAKEAEQQALDASQKEEERSSTKKSTAKQGEGLTDETPDTSDVNENSSKKKDGDKETGASDKEDAAKSEKSVEKINDGSDEKGTKEAGERVGRTAGEIAKVTIRAGDVSRIVSARVKAAGLVDDAAAFNDFLGEHGYDRLLHSGTYEIAVGSSYEEIAKILTDR